MSKPATPWYLESRLKSLGGASDDRCKLAVEPNGAARVSEVHQQQEETFRTACDYSVTKLRPPSSDGAVPGTAAHHTVNTPCLPLGL